MRQLALALLLLNTAPARADEVIVVVGHRPEVPPHHGDPIDHPGRPGGGSPGPEPSTEQRLDAMTKQAFLAEKSMSWAEFSLEVAKQESIMEVTSGIRYEEALAMLRGTLMGIHSDRGDSWEEANNRVSLKIMMDEPFTFKGVRVPLKVPKIEVTNKKTGDQMVFVVASGGYTTEDTYSEMFSDEAHLNKAFTYMHFYKDMTLQQVYDCVQKDQGCPAWPVRDRVIWGPPHGEVMP